MNILKNLIVKYFIIGNMVVNPCEVFHILGCEFHNLEHDSESRCKYFMIGKYKVIELNVFKEFHN